MEALRINTRTTIPLSELTFTFDRSPGPGGQNVNKLNTRAELRFNLRESRALRPNQRARLESSLASRLTADGTLAAMVADESGLVETPVLPGAKCLIEAQELAGFRYFFQHGIANKLKERDPEALAAVAMLARS